MHVVVCYALFHSMLGMHVFAQIGVGGALFAREPLALNRVITVPIGQMTTSKVAMEFGLFQAPSHYFRRNSCCPINQRKLFTICIVITNSAVWYFVEIVIIRFC